MAKFNGPVNLHVGAAAGEQGEIVPAWAQSAWDDEAKTYVVEVSGDDVKRFRAIADMYGFSEVKDA